MGTCARDRLRRGVEASLGALGQGFLGHPENRALRAALHSSSLTAPHFFQQLLRLVYRLIFVLTAEERGLLHPEGSAESARRRYAEGYSLQRLRERSLRRSAHDRHSDLWEAVKIAFRGLARGEPRLGLPALAGLFGAEGCSVLDAAKLENRALLLAVFRLAWLREESGLARVNWRDMGPELGGAYESLLELVPQITRDAGGRFAFAAGREAKRHARKTAGSYYTPERLVQMVLERSLEPVVADAIARHPGDPAAALLGLSIVDPACGSGHFLLAAARRLAAHVARLRAGRTPSAPEYRDALRDVIGSCIYGVDLDAMAVELCKVSLWMEATEPGLPLTFLDSHIRHGNALLGTTPERMANGIPDGARALIERDAPKNASPLERRNERAPAEHRRQKFVADAWCAAFVWPEDPGEIAAAAPTNDSWRQLREGRSEPSTLTAKTVAELAEQYRFFHWPLEFPQVFAKGGFDVVLGNPPWVSYTGRQQSEAPGRMLHLFVRLHPSTRRWPAAHSAFLLTSVRLLSSRGRAGLVLPRQVGDLESYGPVRKEVSSIAALDGTILDAGEDAFPGVTQPVGLFSFAARARSNAGDALWTTGEIASDRDDALEAELVARLAHCPRFAANTFSDPGVHTGNVSKKIVLDTGADSPDFAPIREGRDIVPYACRRPRRRLWSNPSLSQGEYCSIREARRYTDVPILIRQTADRPIAARHVGRTYFRNSLLACGGVRGVSALVVVAFLNSGLFAALHRANACDARQKAFPQVKVRHLHLLPGIPVAALREAFEGRTLGHQIESAARLAERYAAHGNAIPGELRRRIENLVLMAFGLPVHFASTLLGEGGMIATTLERSP